MVLDRPNARLFVCFGLAVLAFASCSGGGSATSPVAVTTPAPSTTTTTASVIFSIAIPAITTASSGVRRAQYVSTGTQSLGIAVNGGTSTYYGLTPATNPNGTTTAGATVCAGLQAVAPVGTDTFVFTLYKETYTGGTPPATALSVAAVPNQVIAIGVANQIGTFTLNPIIGSLALSLTIPGGGFQAGTASSGNAINLTLKDPSGATIIAPGAYVDATNTTTPIGLTSNQTQFTFAVDGGAAAATGTLAGPADSAVLDYSGVGVSGNTTITATAGTFTQSQTISALLKPIVAVLSSAASAADYHITTAPPELDFYSNGITGTIALSEVGYSGTFKLQSDTCNTTDDAGANGNYATFSPGLNGSATSFTVSATAAGSNAHPALCTATFADTNGQTLNVSFSVTTISYSFD